MLYEQLIASHLQETELLQMESRILMITLLTGGQNYLLILAGDSGCLTVEIGGKWRRILVVGKLR